MIFDDDPVTHDAAIAARIQCELCDAGFRRVYGNHWGCACPNLDRQLYAPCARLFATRESDDDGRSWMAYVDGAPLRKRDGDPQRFASAEDAYRAARKASPKQWHDHPEDLEKKRPPARPGTAVAIVLEILDTPRDFPWLTSRDILEIASERGTPVNPGAVGSALAHLEMDDLVEVNRSRRPLRYRKGRGAVAEVHESASTKRVTCPLCDRGFRRVDGVHISSQRLGMIPSTPCARVFAVLALEETRDEAHPWIAYVDGQRLLNKRSGEVRRFASVGDASFAARKASPRRWHE